MAVINRLLQSVPGCLLSLSLVVFPVIALANTQRQPPQQWACRPADNGEWQCRHQATPSGNTTARKNHAGGVKDTGTASTQSSGAFYHQSPAHWDWVAKEQLQPGQTCKTGCDGAYVAPAPAWPDADKKPENALVRANANQSSMENGIVTLSGNVNISQGYRHLQADNITFNQDTGQVQATGHIKLREPNLLLRADEAFVNTQSNLGKFTFSQFLQHDNGTRGQATTIERQSNTLITLDNGRITQCTPDDELWFLKASHISLDSATGWGQAKHARLTVKGIPVFYAPFISFPIDDRRKTGFLFPSFGSSGDNGFEVSAPYYLNLAPNYDATVSPRYISDRGTLAELELRHLSHFGSWVMSGALLKNDDKYTGDDDPLDINLATTDTDTTESGEFEKHNRWLGKIEHSGQIAGITTSIDYTKVSDRRYFKDLSINSLDIKRQTHLNQQITLGYNIGQWQTQLIGQEYQTLDSQIAVQYKLAPRATVEYTGTVDSFTPQWIAKAQITDFQHDSAIDKGGRFETGLRTFGETGVSFPMQWPAGFIIPTTKVRSVHYDMDATSAGRDTTYSATTPLASVDMGLVFERTLHFDNSRYTQTLEPRLYYLYSDYENQNAQPVFDTSELTFSYNQLYRDTRFSGHDRLDDANQTSVGLTTRFINDDTGQEVLTASIGQIFYFKDRQTRISSDINENRLPNSLIATEVLYQPTDQLWFSNTLLWDSRQDYLEEGGLSMQYQGATNTLFNAGYRYRREGGTNIGEGLRDIDQLDLSLSLPLSGRWKVFSRFQYDIEEDRSLEDMFGLAYEDCCWMVRLVYQRGIEDEYVFTNPAELTNNVIVERDHTFVLEFQLKGLGGIGNKAASLLEESILGYTETDD